MDDMPNMQPMDSPLDGLNPADLLRQGAAEDTLFGKPPPFTPPSLEELARIFPRFEILELIGVGGMGAVYKVRQRELDRLVALKILPPAIGERPGFAERFAREARALARLNHPGIVTLHEFGQEDGLYFFLMEFVDGTNLRQLLRNGGISPREAMAIVPQICDALQFAHDQGIVHRDIKPENILLDRRGRVKVADFGIAKLVGSEADPAEGDEHDSEPFVTEAGRIIGTPDYMAPEQIDHPSDVDHRADIYALGVVFYQMLTGELPGERIEVPSKRVRIDVRLDEVVLRALEKNPEHRYANVTEMKTLIEAASSVESAASPADASADKSGNDVVGGKRGGRRNAAIAIFFGLVVLAVVGIVVVPVIGIAVRHMRKPTAPAANVADLPFELQKLSTGRVIDAGLSKPLSPWAWQELERRHLDSADVTRIMDGLTAWLRREHPDGFTEPLSWLDTFLDQLNARGLVRDDQALGFLESFYGKIRCETPLRMREGGRTLQIKAECRNRWVHKLLGLDMMNEVRSLSIDDQSVKPPQSFGRRWNIDDYYDTLPLPVLSPGRHTVRLEILSALVSPDGLTGLASDAPSSDWPPAKKRWTRAAEMELTVYPPDAVIVSQTPDPALDPVASEGLSVKQAIIRSKGTRGVLKFEVNEKLPVSICYDVAMRIGGKTFPCGVLWADKGANGRLGSVSNAEMTFDLTPPAPEIKQANVILTPNPKPVEEVATINRIWGLGIEFEKIPLTRQDLPEAGPVEATDAPKDNMPVAAGPVMKTVAEPPRMSVNMVGIVVLLMAVVVALALAICLVLFLRRKNKTSTGTALGIGCGVLVLGFGLLLLAVISLFWFRYSAVSSHEMRLQEAEQRKQAEAAARMSTRRVLPAEQPGENH